jgi:hypothetical protein
MSWLVDKLPADVIFRVALLKERAEVTIDGIRCEVDVVCPDNIIAYLAALSVANTSAEVKAAALQLLSNAYHRGALRHSDHAVYRRAGEIFSDNLKRMPYEPRHADEARELMARELRRCVVCRIDVYTLFEHYITCVEVGARSYTYAIRRPPKGVFHVIAEDLADALNGINRLLLAQYRATVDTDIETFEALTKIHAKTFC